MRAACRSPITFGRRHDATGAVHRFGDECGDRVGAFEFDQRFEFGDALRGEVRFARARGTINRRDNSITGSLPLPT